MEIKVEVEPHVWQKFGNLIDIHKVASTREELLTKMVLEYTERAEKPAAPVPKKK